MSTCPKCNKQLADGAKFCDACGAQIFETIFCPNCGEQTSTEFSFCQKCGASIVEDLEMTAATTAPTKKNFLQSLSPKTIIFSGIGIIALVVVIIAISMFSGKSHNDTYSLYLKDDEIVYTDYTENGTIEITSHLLNGIEVSDQELYNSAFGLGSYIAFSSDGNRIFFPDRLDDDADGITLYYRDINKPDEDAIKVDSDVVMYAINDSGTEVAYVKGSDRILYIHNLDEKEKIASGVISFNVSNDLNKIGYLNDENSYYLWYADKDSSKLASDITSIQYVAPDLSEIYYIKDGSLYKQIEGGQDKEKIASDVSRVIKIYDSGEVYYTKANSTEKNLMDYVDDDMAASDSTMTEPEYPDYPESPDYPYWWDYDTDAEYEAAKAQYEADYGVYEATCDQIRADYNAAYDAYRAKQNRDSLRENLQNETMESTEYTLCYFNGTEETIVTDALVDEWSVNYASDKSVMILPVYNQSNIPKVKLSEITSVSEVSDLVNAALYSSSDKYVAVGSSLSILEQTNATYFRLSSDGSMLYFLDDISDSGDGDLYKVTITDGQVGKPEIYDSDVSNHDIFFTATGSIGYYKNVKEEDYKGDLYINAEKIDYDVYFWSISYLDDAILYYTDWNIDKSYGTLKIFRSGTATKIADDVHVFDITSDGNILYLYDYSTNYYTGTLYLYNNGESKKIDDDVIALVPVYDHIIMGEDYYGY